MAHRGQYNLKALVVAVIAGLILGLGPMATIPLFGYDVSTAAQPNFTGPAPTMQAGQTWSQTFFFPDRPVSAVSLRPGTFGKISQGQVIGKIAIQDSEQNIEKRRFIINLPHLRDNNWHTFRFDPLTLASGTRAVLLLEGDRLPEDSQTITFWRNSQNCFSDGVFRIDNTRIPGALAFKIISHVRGLDALRMLKTRWLADRSGPWSSLFLPVVTCLGWTLLCMLSFYFLISKRGDR